ncbi:Transmembrane protein 174 [Triplophysa tibetana]|uniref:Transmembrane protein 174 n=1 Tax=Triplophysa tibetana TaxID=1572043 RepID=A0A5A9P5I2_9TELE|nr:Transmembrane protein 174 [Triplophysa tibetana]
MESRNHRINPPDQSDAVASLCNSISNLNHSPSNVPVTPSRVPSCTDSLVSDGDKAGATLLFSGAFLTLIGMTLTAMGWTKYNVNQSYEWTQLLGPILLSVGGMFVLISVCKFRMLSCQSCRQNVGERTSDTDTQPPHSGPSFVFTGLNQPITFHRATVVQYIPPPYGSLIQDQSLGTADGLHYGNQPLTVTVNPPPQYYSVYPMENLAFISGEYDGAAVEQRESRNPSRSGEVEEGKVNTADSAASPPAYEDIFAASSFVVAKPYIFLEGVKEKQRGLGNLVTWEAPGVLLSEDHPSESCLDKQKS